MVEISRRTLLRRGLLVSALGGGAVLGMTRPVQHKVAVPPPAPPAALPAALDRQRQLLAGYDQVLAGRPDPGALAGLRADIAAHGDALRAVLERYPGWRLTAAASTAPASTAPADSAAPSGSPTQGGAPATTVDDLAAASSAGAAAASRACLDWPPTEAHAAVVVPLLGSIAASLGSHARVLA